MTSEEKNKIVQMRESGLRYTRIAQELGLSQNTVSSFCRRNNLTSEVSAIPKTVLQQKANEKPCLNCGIPVLQNPGRKEKKFCCDRCRNKWWNSHLSLVERKANYEYVCPACGERFTVYGNSHRKYCSHECYIKDRFGGTVCD